MARKHETRYHYQIEPDAAIDVRFLTSRGEVFSYSVVLLADEHGTWHAVRSYDNAHQTHDMHRYNRAGEKQPAETFHQSSAGEALQSAIDTVRRGYREVIEAWRR